MDCGRWNREKGDCKEAGRRGVSCTSYVCVSVFASYAYDDLSVSCSG